MKRTGHTRPLLYLAASALCLLSAGGAWANPLAGWHQHNSAEMRWMGLRVYRIALWSAGPEFTDKAPFALELEYAMAFEGAEIAARSIEEMQAQGHVEDRQLARWRHAMTELFPNVRPGDRLLGIAIPGREARFYAAGKFLGRVADPAFVRAFFDIWLSQDTRAPRVRDNLLARKP